MFQVMGQSNRDTGRLDDEHVADPGIPGDARASAIPFGYVPVAATDERRRYLRQAVDHRSHVQVSGMEYPVAGGE